jgi:hypothetical protein
MDTRMVNILAVDRSRTVRGSSGSVTTVPYRNETAGYWGTRVSEHERREREREERDDGSLHRSVIAASQRQDGRRISGNYGNYGAEEKPGTEPAA